MPVMSLILHWSTKQIKIMCPIKETQVLLKRIPFASVVLKSQKNLI